MNNKILFISTITLLFLLLYSCGGNDNNVQPTPSSSNESSQASATTVNGEEIYKKTCIACHQANGEGILNTFPPLAKSDFLSDKSQVIDQVIHGKTGEMTVNGVKYNSIMPPQTLNDEEVAAVLTYVYSSWGNNGTAVTAEEVKSERSKKI